MGKTKNYMKLLLIVGLFFTQQIVSRISGEIANFFDYSRIDKNSVFAWISVHHIIQMIITLAIIYGLVKVFKMDFKFRVGNVRSGIKYVLIFTTLIFIYALIYYISGKCFGGLKEYPYELNIKNIIGSLSFQMFLSGPSEEVLFRAFPIILCIYLLGSKKEFKMWKWSISLVSLIAAVFFAIAHVSYSFNPFTVNADVFQLIYSFVLGVFYGEAYLNSDSVIYPITMHSVSNVIMVGAGYMFDII